MHEVHTGCGDRTQSQGDARRPIRLVLVDDHRLFREGLRAVISRESDLVLAGEAGDGASAFALLESTPADVVLVDVGLPDMPGIDVARELKRRGAACRVLILTAGNTVDGAKEAHAAGACGYILKTEPASTVVQAVRTIAKGDSYWPTVAPGGTPAASATLTSLSRREREIFELIIVGHSNESIRQRLHISVKTVETHRTSINRKLNVHSTAELVRFAATRGLLPATATVGPPPEVQATRVEG